MARKSLKAIQAEALNETLIDSLGNGRTDYASIKEAPIMEQLLIEVVGNFLLQVQENIKTANKVDTGRLSEELAQSDLLNRKGVYSIEAGYPLDSKAADYASFVNQGVKGFTSGNPADSPFSFKSAWASRDGIMTDAIMKWLKSTARSSRNEDQRENLSNLQSKRQSVSEIQRERSNAQFVASRIKQKGLEKTDFFTSAVRQYFGDEFVAAVGSAFLSDVRVYIKQANQLINNEQKN